MSTLEELLKKKHDHRVEKLKKSGVEFDKIDWFNDDRYFEHKEDGWYFYDGSWADLIGPYATREIAQREIRKYCNWMDHGPEEIIILQDEWWPIDEIKTNDSYFVVAKAIELEDGDPKPVWIHNWIPGKIAFKQGYTHYFKLKDPTIEKWKKE
jgi:hypothetical protein